MENTTTKANQFPKIVEISRNKKPFKVNPKDPNFDKPLSSLFVDYGVNPNYSIIIEIN